MTKSFLFLEVRRKILFYLLNYGNCILIWNVNIFILIDSWTVANITDIWKNMICNIFKSYFVIKNIPYQNVKIKGVACQPFIILVNVLLLKSGPPWWSWSYGSWIYNYLCNQCLSPLTLCSFSTIPRFRLITYRLAQGKYFQHMQKRGQTPGWKLPPDLIDLRLL